jgi:hypothetical protein
MKFWLKRKRDGQIIDIKSIIEVVSNSIFIFVTTVANKYNHLPQRTFWAIFSDSFMLILTIRGETDRKILIFPKHDSFKSYFQQSHSPHFNGHSPHVASGEWVRQR